MPTLKQIIFTSAFIFALLSTSIAQESTSAPAQTSSLTITAAATADRVRITAPSSIVQMHVEVYAVSGEKLFDQEIRGGNVFDWHLQDGQAQRLAPGNYVCVVTAKSVSGRLTQKIGTVSVAEKSAIVQPAESKQLSATQAQTIGPVEENSSWMVAGEAEPQTPTVIAHDGTDGQMIRGRGALTFRIGNFFSGLDTEQMRLTEAGNLGIGTSEPKSKLEVAGTIRAERFLVVKPGQTSNAAGDPGQTTDAADPVQPLVAGTGTTDSIAKWTDNAGTLGNAAITETGGKVGIGTTTPAQALEVANGRIAITGSQTSAVPGGLLEIGTTLTNNNNQASGIRMRNTFNGNATNQVALDVAPTFAPSANISLARGFISAAFFAPPPGVTITDALGGVAANVYNNTGGAVTNGTAFSLNSPIVFGPLKPTTQYGLRINNQGISGTTNSYGLFVDAQSGSTNNYSAVFAGGNVGIGTPAPTAKLDIRENSALIRFSGVNCGPDFGAITFGNVALGCNNYSLLGEGSNTFINRPAGGAITFRENNLTQMQINPGGSVGIGTIVPQGTLTVRTSHSGPDFSVFDVQDVNGNPVFEVASEGKTFIGHLESPGTTQLCLNGKDLASCSSSLRYKRDIEPFVSGLGILNRLQPISFTWKTNGTRDLGLGAEDVAKVEPLLITHNDKGQIEGVKYDRLNVVLINAVKEQQKEIEQMKEQLREQQQQLYALNRRLHRRSLK